jgi:hypothetical protein
MAERIYAAVGFRDLGRVLEYVPADRKLRGLWPVRRGRSLLVRGFSVVLEAWRGR